MYLGQQSRLPWVRTPSEPVAPVGCSCYVGLSKHACGRLLGVARACPAVLPSAHPIEAYAMATFRSGPENTDETSGVGERGRGDAVLGCEFQAALGGIGAQASSSSDQ